MHRGSDESGKGGGARGANDRSGAPMARTTDRLTPMAELEDRILPWSQVKVISGLSRTTVWRLQRTGDFPASVQVSPNRVGWRQSELLDWKRARQPRRLPEPRALEPAPTEPARFLRATVARPAAQVATPPRKRPRSRPRVPPEQGVFDF